MASYDLIEIYCELIAARLPMIESLKCADLPELVDVRKHLTVKYGKEFASAAVELRPDYGVNRLLVEKLSAKAPDGPTKIKILSAINEEHNIKWEPKSFGENDIKPSQDLLAGPKTFEKATYAEPSQVHVPAAVRDEKGLPNEQASSQFKPVYDRPTGSDAQNTSDATRKDTGNQSRPSGTGNQEMHYRDSYSENSSAFPTVKQNWNMEFKDAASAAQAAAESAERASMAARAAAELSSHENVARQRSSESHSSPRSQLRDEIPQEYSFNDDKNLSTAFAYTTFHRGSSGMNNEKINTREQN
ncbi:sericin [Arachis hypogaea]|uniref:Sericin n=1 Tax=Arachis hypogaea TaxID=3818 RepID=A0A6B9VAK0_ARAHY|nr:sericin [Arachis hypogaea]